MLKRFSNDAEDFLPQRANDSVGRAGDEYDTLQLRGSLLPQVADDGHAALERHHEVEEDRGVVLLPEGADGVVAADEAVDPVAGALEKERDETAHGAVIIEHEDALAAPEGEHGREVYDDGALVRSTGFEPVTTCV